MSGSKAPAQQPRPCQEDCAATTAAGMTQWTLCNREGSFAHIQSLLNDLVSQSVGSTGSHAELFAYVAAFVEHHQFRAAPLQYSLVAADSPEFHQFQTGLLAAFDSWLAARGKPTQPAAQADIPVWAASSCADLSRACGPPACLAAQLLLSLLRYMPDCRLASALPVMEKALIDTFSLMLSLAGDDVVRSASWMPRYISHVLTASLQLLSAELEKLEIAAVPKVYFALWLDIVELVEAPGAEYAVVQNDAMACMCTEGSVPVLIAKVLDCSPGARGGEFAALGGRLLRLLLRYEQPPDGVQATAHAGKLTTRLVTGHQVVIERIMVHTRAMPVDASKPYNEVFWHCACYLAAESSSWPVFRDCRAFSGAMLALTRPVAARKPESCIVVANFIHCLAMDPDCFEPFKPFVGRLPAIIGGFETLCNIVTGTCVAPKPQAEAAVFSLLAEHHKDAMLDEIWEMGFGRGVTLLLGMWGVAGWQLRAKLIDMLHRMHERVWTTNDRPGPTSLGPAAWLAVAGMLKDIRNAPDGLEVASRQRLAYIVRGYARICNFCPQAKASLRAHQAHVDVAHILLHTVGRMPKEDHGMFGFQTGWGLFAGMLGGALGELVEPSDYEPPSTDEPSIVTASISALAEVLLTPGQHPKHCGCADGFPCAARAPSGHRASNSTFTAALQGLLTVVPLLELLGDSFCLHQGLMFHFIKKDHILHAHQLVAMWAYAVLRVNITHQQYPIARDGFFNATHALAMLLVVASSGQIVQPTPCWLPSMGQMLLLRDALHKSLTNKHADDWHPRVMGAFSYIAQSLLLIPQLQTPWSEPMAACLLDHLTVFLANSKSAVDARKSRAPPAQARTALAKLRQRASGLAVVVCRALEATRTFYTPLYQTVQQLTDSISDTAQRKSLITADIRKELKALLDSYEHEHKASADAADQAAAALLEEEAAATQSADAAKQRRKEKKARQKKSKAAMSPPNATSADAAMSAADAPAACEAAAAVTAPSHAAGTEPNRDSPQEAAPSTARPAGQPAADSTSLPGSQPAARPGHDQHSGSSTHAPDAGTGSSSAASARSLRAGGDSEAAGQGDIWQAKAQSLSLAADPVQHSAPTAMGELPARAANGAAALASPSTPHAINSRVEDHDVVKSLQASTAMLEHLSLNMQDAAAVRSQAATTPRSPPQPARYDPLQHLRQGGRSGPGVAAPQRSPPTLSTRQQAGRGAANGAMVRPQPSAQAGGPAAHGAPASAPPAAIGAEQVRSSGHAGLDMADMECPITQEVMTDPVIAADGHTYERSAIEQWLSTHNTSPMTNEPLSATDLISNVLVRRLIASYRGTS